MASGVKVDPKCVEAFTSLIKNRTYRCAIYKITDDMTAVEVDKTYGPSEGSPKEEWEEVKKGLPEDDCRYVAYDFSFSHQGAMKQRVIFVLWSPEASKVRSKMIYAASQEGVVSTLAGVQRQIQCNDPEDIDYDCIAKQLAAHTAGY